MQIGVQLPELGIEFDLSKVTFVQAMCDHFEGKAIIFLDVHFVGGETLSLPEWDMSKWMDLKNKLRFQLSMQQKAG